MQDDTLNQVLERSPWADWRRAPVAGDASARRYLRLTAPEGSETVIAMDAGRDSAGEITRFVAMAKHLRSIGLQAPEVLLHDSGRGIVVMEDLGPNQLAAWLRQHPEDETEAYLAAVDMVVRVQSAPPPPGLTRMDPATAAGMTDVLAEWYLTDPAPGPAIAAALRDALEARTDPALVLSLRDFHAENLVWRAERGDLARLGVLDFQDAVLADASYDLVSLLRDARRDVSPATAAAATARFVAERGLDPDMFGARMAVVAVQRNLRILGIFARLIRRDGKPRYAAFVPRVWRMLGEDLGHPDLGLLRRRIAPLLPSPEESGLAEALRT
ncbi:MAG: phosphotransferase [Limimaricola sp.]|uniref:aminoglycoside phosphotransferase family protein n=1 Tax=Limimaricola sp. TaxID=2211665 RepID=UPI001DAE766C|nr:phosphotransferase [Limimaricola sp.]MBI1417237.1 phosphotransferase [Limimaricola sp.]